MTAVSGPLWPVYALAIVVCLFGFGFGVCAVLGPGPGRAPDPAPPPPAPMPPLPRAGRFTLLEDRPAPVPLPPEGLWDTVPLVLLSEHYAVLDATGREADQLDAEWRRKYLT